MKVFLLLILILAPHIAQAKRKILISYFAPFQQHKSNHSRDVAEKINELLASDKDLEVILCPLNKQQNTLGVNVALHSDRTNIQLDGQLGTLKGTSAYSELVDCYEKNSDASQVISLGQSLCKIRIESGATNKMSTGYGANLADNNGNLIPTIEKISETGPERISTDDANILTTCLEQVRKKKKSLIEYSYDAGQFVCNNLIYNFQKKINENKLNLPFSFIHVPRKYKEAVDSCGDSIDKDYSKVIKKRINNDNFTEAVANQVISFIRQKEIVLTNLRSNEKSEKDPLNCISTHSGEDDLTNSLKTINAFLNGNAESNPLNNPDVKECISKLKRNQVSRNETH